MTDPDMDRPAAADATGPTGPTKPTRPAGTAGLTRPTGSGDTAARVDTQTVGPGGTGAADE